MMEDAKDENIPSTAARKWKPIHRDSILSYNRFPFSSFGLSFVKLISWHLRLVI